MSIQYSTFERQLRYDTRGRMIIQIDRWQEDGLWRERTTRRFYDARGREITSRDPAGRETVYAYDALGRLSATIDALGQVTRTTTTPAGGHVSGGAHSPTGCAGRASASICHLDQGGFSC